METANRRGRRICIVPGRLRSTDVAGVNLDAGQVWVNLQAFALCHSRLARRLHSMQAR